MLGLRKIAYLSFGSLGFACGVDQVSTSADVDQGPNANLPDTLSKLVGPEGGELRVRGVTLRVPSGALQDKTLLTVANLGDDAQSRLAPLTTNARFLARPTSFSPHGLQFLKAAQISIDVDDERATAIEIRRLDDETDPTWTLLNEVSLDDVVSFDTRRFSIYALTSVVLGAGGSLSGAGGSGAASSGGAKSGSGGSSPSGGAPTSGSGGSIYGGDSSSWGGAAEGGAVDGAASEEAD